MNELIEKTENLKKAIDQTDVIKSYKKARKKVENDNDLMNDIKNYHEENSEKKKETILKNHDFRDYKQKESDVNILILEINQELKKINNKGKCIK